MAKSNWELDLRQLVVNMDPGKRQELFSAVVQFKSPDQVRAMPPADQTRAWLRKNGPLAAALRTELDQGVKFGLSAGEKETVSMVIEKIGTAYRYAVGDWNNDPNGIAYANESIQEAQELEGYAKFQELSKHVSVNQEQYAKQVYSAEQAAANTAKQKAEKQARDARQQEIKSADNSLLVQLRNRNEATLDEVMCLLIAPSGARYLASHLTFLADGETHAIARQISQMDGLDHSIKSCAEFKAINTYLTRDLPNAVDLAEVPRGGHTIAYVYKKEGQGLEPKSKAPCTNCGNWLTKLGWTSATGRY